MVNKMHWILCISILVCGLYGGSSYVAAQECSSIPLSDPTRVVATPPQSGGNYSFYELVTLSCNSSGEYTFTGNDYSYCVGNNQWDPDPSTVICYEKCAGSLIPGDVIQVDTGGTTKSYYEHGEYIYLNCTESQTLIGPNRVACQDGSIGDDTIACQGGTTTAVYTTKKTTTTPSTPVPQDESTLAFQTIINTAMVSTTSGDGSFTTGRTDAATKVQTKILTSIDYITDKPSTFSRSTDLYEATTFQTVIATDTTGHTTNMKPTISTRATTDKATTAFTDIPVTFSTHFTGTDIVTDAITDAITDVVTDAVTDTITDAVTDTVTYVVTDAATDVVTDAVTDAATGVVTDAVTDAITDVVTYAVTDALTYVATDSVVTDVITYVVTDTVTVALTDVITDAVTDGKTQIITKFITDDVTDSATDVITDVVTDAVTDPITYTITYTVTDTVTEAISEVITEVETDTVTDYMTDAVTDVVTDAITDAITEVVTEVVTDAETKAATDVITEIVTYFATDSVATELPGTDSNDVPTMTTDISATNDDDVTTSITAVTELVSTRVTVITEVITEINEFTEFTTPRDSNMTTMLPDPCQTCDPDRERCVNGSGGPVCECLQGFYRITESDTGVQCTEAILFEVDARITEINDQVVEFSEDLKNSSSARFNYLQDLICNTVDTVQYSISGFLACQVTSFSNGSIIAVIDLYFDELSNATEIEVYNETVAAFDESNITAEVTRVKLVVPSTSTTVSATTPPKTTTTTTTGTAGGTSQTGAITTQFITTAKPANKSTADITLLVIYILIPVLAVLLLIAIGFIFYQNKKVSARYGKNNPGGKKPKKAKTPKKKTKTSTKETNGHVNIAFYDGINTGKDKCTQTTGIQTIADDRPDSGVVVTEDIDHMVYPYPWNEPGRLEADDDDKVIYAKVDRQSKKESVTHKNPPVIVEIELQAVVADEPQISPVDWTAVDATFVAVEEETSITEAVKEDSAHNLDDQAVEGLYIDNEEYEAKDTGSQTEIDEEPDYIAIGGFELNEASSNHASLSQDLDALDLDCISLELTASMETEMDRRLYRNISTPC